MKKILILLLGIMLAGSLLACQPDEPISLEGISLKAGTYLTQIELGEDLNTADVVVIAKYSDGSEQEIAADKLTFTGFDKTLLGTQTVNVAFEDKQTSFEVTVITPVPVYNIIGVNAPTSITIYNVNIGEKTNKETEYNVRDDGYYVGDDNDFRFYPIVSCEDDDGLPVEVPENVLDAEINAYVLQQDSSYKKEAGIVSSSAYGRIRFDSSVIGKTVKLEFTPFVKGTDVDANYTQTFIVKVVDGYNLYDAKELSLIENGKRIRHKEMAKFWTEFKNANGISVDLSPKALIFHNNITLTSADIPSAFFYTDGDEDLKPSDSDYSRAKDSLRDNYDIFSRLIEEDDSFSIIGNYYQLDAKGMPYVVRDMGKVTEEGMVISHATLFRLEGEGKDKSSASIKNLNILGNSNRTENKIASGGLIFNKSMNINFSAVNNIGRAWFINYFAEKAKDEETIYSINKCKSYDSFNCMIYSWGCDSLLINDSEFIGTGGPVIIMDHVTPNDTNGGYPSATKVTNSTLKTSVAGSEGWFSLVGATAAVPQIKALDSIFRAYGRTFLTNADGGTTIGSEEVSYFNFVCLIKSGDAATLSFDPIRGSFQNDDDAALDFGATNQVLGAYLENLKGRGAPVFQSSAGGIAFFNGTQLTQFNATGGMDPLTNLADPLFSGDFINVYLANAGSNGYMALNFGYYPLTAK